ncbi:MAG: hypothetical protein EBT97_10075 [Actinobacteria bacterium]|nr:hypothetical protein [Actinomycetota bacterium]
MPDPMTDRVRRYQELEAELRRVRPDPGTPEYLSNMDRLEDLWYSMTPDERRALEGNVGHRDGVGRRDGGPKRTNDWESLPPYDPDQKCPKCGHDEVATKYIVAWVSDVKREALHRCCGRCGYGWNQATVGDDRR